MLFSYFTFLFSIEEKHVSDFSVALFIKLILIVLIINFLQCDSDLIT